MTADPTRLPDVQQAYDALHERGDDPGSVYAIDAVQRVGAPRTDDDPALLLVGGIHDQATGRVIPLACWPT
jgi:hypothetical protein